MYVSFWAKPCRDIGPPLPLFDSDTPSPVEQCPRMTTVHCSSHSEENCWERMAVLDASYIHMSFSVFLIGTATQWENLSQKRGMTFGSISPA